MLVVTLKKGEELVINGVKMFVAHNHTSSKIKVAFPADEMKKTDVIEIKRKGDAKDKKWLFDKVFKE